MIFWQIWLMQPMQQPSWCGLGRSAGTPSACCVWRARLSSAGWGDIATKLPDEVIKATPEIPWREVKGMRIIAAQGHEGDQRLATDQAGGKRPGKRSLVQQRGDISVQDGWVHG